MQCRRLQKAWRDYEKWALAVSAADAAQQAAYPQGPTASAHSTANLAAEAKPSANNIVRASAAQAGQASERPGNTPALQDTSNSAGVAAASQLQLPLPLPPQELSLADCVLCGTQTSLWLSCPAREHKLCEDCLDGWTESKSAKVDRHKAQDLGSVCCPCKPASVQDRPAK